MSIIFATVAAFMSVSALTADVVKYDNGAPDQFTGSEMTHFIQSEDFVLGSDASITGVNLWALDTIGVSAYQGTIFWAIAADAAGAPGAAFASGSAAATVTGTGNTVLTYNEDLVSFLIPAFTATGGTTYWLEIHNGPTTTNSPLGFFWETTSSSPGSDLNTGHEMVLPGGTLWGDNGFDHSFELTGPAAAVPEPGSAVLLTVAGLVGIIARRHIRSN
jgi:hypothetical protein